MAFNFFNRGRAEKAKAYGDRLPPGQYVTEKWPVLHYGSVPKFDSAKWDFRVWGLVENPIQLSYEQFKALPTTTVQTHQALSMRLTSVVTRPCPVKAVTRAPA